MKLGKHQEKAMRALGKSKQGFEVDKRSQNGITTMCKGERFACVFFDVSASLQRSGLVEPGKGFELFLTEAGREWLATDAAASQ